MAGNGNGFDVSVLDRNNFSKLSHQPSVERIINSLISQETSLALLQDGYVSPSTLLIESRKNNLIFQKPSDWPGANAPFTVSFRAPDTGMHSLFNVKIVKIKSGNLMTEFPEIIYQLQRRKYYRVDAPLGSTISFLNGGHHNKGYTLKNISAGGALFCTLPGSDIRFRDLKISEITIAIPAQAQFPAMLHHPMAVSTIAQGQIVRTYDDEQKRWHAVSFKPTRSEEESMVQFVRQHELEMLRKGLATF